MNIREAVGRRFPQVLFIFVLGGAFFVFSDYRLSGFLNSLRLYKIIQQKIMEAFYDKRIIADRVLDFYFFGGAA